MFGLVEGAIVPLGAASIPLWDLGFAQGVAVTEQLRTLGHKPWLVDLHLDRLEQGLRLAWLEWPAVLGANPRTELERLLHDLIAATAAELDPGDDLGCCVVVTGGDHGRFRPLSATPLSGTRLVGHTFRLPHAELARRHREGVRLVTVPTREIPGSSLDRRLKSRSRMHYWIAQHQAEFSLPGAQALLLDSAGQVAESPAATIVAIDGRTRRCLLPPAEAILPGTCLAWFLELVSRSGLEICRQPFEVSELQSASEVLSLSTPGVVAPVIEVDGARIGNGEVGGEFYWRAILEIGEANGVDLIHQSQRFAEA